MGQRWAKTSSMVGPGDAIVLSPDVGHIDPEAEPSIVIVHSARNLTLENASEVVLGFMIGNDVLAREA
ncbi:fumarylacetoacetate hydrolase family protein [Arthrobacter sp. TMP15]|uniref:fumarylacetoacetate hydrolase family protein n=1 Tax=Arthrobacter sp. TMP15 TaxID=3140789 RepID=UPI0031BA659A